GPAPLFAAQAGSTAWLNSAETAERDDDETSRPRRAQDAQNSLAPIGGEGQGEGATRQTPHSHRPGPRLRPPSPKEIHQRRKATLVPAARPPLRRVQIPPSISVRHLFPRLLLHARQVGRGTRRRRTRLPGSADKR